MLGINKNKIAPAKAFLASGEIAATHKEPLTSKVEITTRFKNP